MNNVELSAKKCAVVYHVFAKYRYPIFQRLVNLNSKELSCSIFYDPDYKTTVEKIDPGAANKGPWRKVKNVPIWGGLLWQRGVLKLAWSNEFDTLILLGDAYILSTWAAVVVARVRGKRVLFWTHGLYGRESRLKLVIRVFFYKLANGLLLYGNHAWMLLRKQGFSSSSLYRVYNSLDYELQRDANSGFVAQDLAALREELFPSTSNYPLLCFVGRLISAKKLHLIIEAMAALRVHKNVDINLLLVGDGEARKGLEILVTKHQLQGRVHFFGACYDEAEVGRLIAASSLCVSPGNIGLTAVHSLTYGTPVITHDSSQYQGPEFEAVIPGYNGEYFERDNVDSLAQQIEHWFLKNPTHATSQVRARCKEIIDEFYNPNYQVKVLQAAICNESADDITGSEGFILRRSLRDAS